MGAVNFSIDIGLLTTLKKRLPINVFVETGTFRGDSIELIRNQFREIYTVEFSREYFDEARVRFAGSEHINVIFGDSPSVLDNLAPKLRERSVCYFLDAHWCEAENTAGKTSQCPLLDEVQAIARLNSESLIIIDDARLFLAPPPHPHEISQWPDFDKVLSALHGTSSNHKIIVLNDTIIYYPNSINDDILKYAQSSGVDWLEVTHKTKDYDNLKSQFYGLNSQLIEKDAEIVRLTAAMIRDQIGHKPVAMPVPAALAVTNPAMSGVGESLLIELAEKTARIQSLTADLSEARTVQIEKEEVIRALAKAVFAYRLAYTAIKPIGMLLSPFSLIARHGRAMLRPRLGNLNQYPPQALTQPKADQRIAQLSATPKISIVTPSFRQGAFIEKTLLSVFEQQYPNLEYFVQDGGSQDSTVAILEKHKDKFAGWESEDDSGQSQAINRGFAKTSGEIMAWLNSDDLLLPGALATVADYFNRHPEVDVLYGNRLLIDENDMEIGRWIMPGHDSAALSWVDYVPQETLFWRRRIWDKVGGQIDESFRFAMDWDLLVRFRDAGAKFAHIPRFMGAFRIHQHQKTSANINDIGHQEMDRIRERLLGRVPSRKEIRNAALPFLLKHVAVDLGYRVKRRLGSR